LPSATYHPGALAVLLCRHRADDSVNGAIGRLIRADLIVIDDIGMLPVAPNAAEAPFLRPQGSGRQRDCRDPTAAAGEKPMTVDTGPLEVMRRG
jgi:hypothetical protein